MLDLLDYVACLAAVSVGFVIGRKSVPAPPVPPQEAHPDGTKPICSCEHFYGQHRDGKSCQADMRKFTKQTSRPTPNNPDIFKWVKCTCTCYDGPAIHLF